jgi:NADH-quinone oxidoreductase subunit A
MGDVEQISEFGKILVFLIIGIILVAVIFFINRLASPKNLTAEKLTSYECGEEPTGSAWLPFNPRFYVIALVFLLFEVEMVFVFPWSTVFGNHDVIGFEPRWGILSLIEMFVFLGILILGLVYVWRKGDLEWIKPQPIKPTTTVKVPASLYEKLNTEQSNYKVKAFTATFNNEPTQPSTTATQTATSIKKPLFKPTFKKPENE